jgi:two-component system, cell cycle sensor histidine kinase and response regulator CckA
MVVLLAEGDVQLQYSIWKVLKADGFTVLNFGNGELALEASRSHPGPIELLLTDIQMPRMDGLELSRNIRAERPGIKVLVMSSDLRGRDHAALNGLLYLQKPFTLAALRDSITALLGQPVHLGQIPPLK